MPATTENGKDTPSPTTITAEDKDDCDALNGALDRMRAVLPPNPYILTIPQDVEPRYHHSYQFQAVQWLHQAPFEWKEGEMVQYQTFFYHEQGKDMYVLHNSLPREERNAGAKTRPGTGANTPNAAPKKKISLDAYKKAKTGNNTPAQDGAPAKGSDATVKQPAVKGPVERVKAETSEVLAAVADEPEVPSTQPKKIREGTELKRKREVDEETDDQKQKGVATGKGEEPVAKKLRTSPLPVLQEIDERSEQGKQTSKLKRSPPPPRPATPPATSEDAGLPPRLSPLQVPSMPSRLSPSFPDNIEASLKARGHSKAPASDDPVPNSAGKSTKLAPAVNADGVTKHQSPAPRNGFRASSSSPSMRRNAEDAEKQPQKSAGLQRSSELTKDDEKEVGRSLKAQRTAPESLLVKLRYKKPQRDAVRRILSMRPQPKARTSSTPQNATSSPVDDEKAEKSVGSKLDTSAKGIAQKIGPATKGVAQKVGPANNSVAKKKAEGQPTPKAETDKSTSATSAAKKSEKPDTVQKRNRSPTTDEHGKRPQPGPDEKQAVKNTNNTTGEEQAVGPDKSPRAIEKTKKADVSGAKPGEPAAKRKAEAPEEDTKAPATKRKKVLDTTETTKEEPNTPDTPSSGLPNQGSKPRQQQPKPRKDHLSSTVQREQSTDQNVNTPSAKSNTPTINQNSQPNGVAKAPSSQPSSKTPKQQLWEVEQKRLETLGRKLKHAATAHLDSPQIPTKKGAAPTNDQKLAAIKATESLLCYFLAFSAADEAALAAEPRQNPSNKTWRSLQGFFNFVKRITEPFPILQGLVCHLGVVFNARILDITVHFFTPAERQARDSTHTSDTYAALAKYAGEAEEKLDIDLLQASFPRTWKGRKKGGSVPPSTAPATEKLSGPADFAGDYKLPITVSTSPLHAARAGYSMLGEWIARQSVEYERELKL
ncbi:hypothetical protein KC340_g6851 [Hortaea werneckii]|nr:hypothetical protein KC342_g10605 [Hortaea werneckii]KAI7095848.1 hypothetical protein KC339_g10767 [Hortaea werneckii]KAI7244409.1 hypothetical protein KC365_g1436 [Hortaea werneckii]KAI7322885.1 hypothetical protein KC340_g6851 [Hortaea werneckii]KAI7402331.1 hypothetical protein KC328_g2825 [Hortaea werneckii]